jgi:hypothetical protein
MLFGLKRKLSVVGLQSAVKITINKDAIDTNGAVTGNLVFLMVAQSYLDIS